MGRAVDTLVMDGGKALAPISGNDETSEGDSQPDGELCDVSRVEMCDVRGLMVMMMIGSVNC